MVSFTESFIFLTIYFQKQILSCNSRSSNYDALSETVIVPKNGFKNTVKSEFVWNWNYFIYFFKNYFIFW